jgi:hypothetical protein
MKNNNDHQYEIRKARDTAVARATTDVLLNPVVVEQNASKLGPRTVRKRKTNYVKKIQNDPFIFNV